MSVCQFDKAAAVFSTSINETLPWIDLAHIQSVCQRTLDGLDMVDSETLTWEHKRAATLAHRPRLEESSNASFRFRRRVMSQ